MLKKKGGENGAGNQHGGEVVEYVDQHLFADRRIDLFDHQFYGVSGVRIYSGSSIYYSGRNLFYGQSPEETLPGRLTAEVGGW